MATLWSLPAAFGSHRNFFTTTTYTVDEWHASHASPRSSICTPCVLMCPSVCMLQVARAPLHLLALMLPPTPAVWLLLAAAS